MQWEAVADQRKALAVWLVADSAQWEAVAGQGKALTVCLVASARGGGSRQRESFGGLAGGRRRLRGGGSKPREGFGGMVGGRGAALLEVVAGQGKAITVCLVAGAALAVACLPSVCAGKLVYL